MTTTINKNAIKCAVFDLDGTLLNTIKTINYYLNFALSKHGLSSVREEDCMQFVGDGAKKLISRALDKVGADSSLFDSVYKLYNDAYNSSPFYLTEVYDGIFDALIVMKKKGIKLAVLSNKPDFAVRATVSKFFPNCFDVVRGGIEGIPLKPSPNSLFDILKQLGAAPAEAAYIGDSEPDVLTARSAEVGAAIFVSWGFRSACQLKEAGAKTIISTPDEILKIINV